MKIKGENPQLLEELEHLRQRVAELEQVKKERKLAEEVLQESEERYKLLVESSNQAIFTVDKSGLFLFMNTSAARQLGGKPKDFRGKTMWDLFPKEIANRQMADIRKAMETASQLITESASFMQGEKRWFEMNIQPIRNSSGVFDKVLCIAADITERKQAEEERKKKHEELERFNALAVDRELKMIELKREINVLLEKLGKVPRYEIPEESMAEVTK